MGVALKLLGEHSAVNGNGKIEIDPEELLLIYRQGVRCALVAVGVGFGLEPVGDGSQSKPSVSPPLAGLLWAEAPYETRMK